MKTGNAAKLPALLTMSRTSNGKWIIDVTDAVSRSEILHLEVSDAAFSRAIGHLGYQPAEAEWRPAALGKKYEVKTVPVPAVKFDGNRESGLAKERAAIAPFEVDGWRGDIDDMSNMHKRKGAHQMVTFRRYVESTEEDVEAARKDLERRE